MPAESNSNNTKRVPFGAAAAFFEDLRRGGERLVQCHGTFDLLHPGHIDHLESARALGDRLVVTVTAEGFVNKGPGRPYFNDELRVRSLEALGCVDHVVVVPHPAAVEAIECVRPDIYCKGVEYADAGNDVTGNIRDDVEAVRRLGGEVRYVGSVVYSSTRLLNNHFDHLDPRVAAVCRPLAEAFGADRFRAAVEAFADLNVLVVGDVIFDRYSYLQVQGLTSKNQIISGRFVREETHLGGALAAFRHVRAFCPRAALLGLVGEEPWVEGALAEVFAPGEDQLVRAPGYSTVVKQRFVEDEGPAKAKEVSKLFAVNYLDRGPPAAGVAEGVRERAGALLGGYDVVLVLDFGHGLMSEALRDLVQERAPFLGLNCQTNSNNHGFNLINRRYRRADAFSLDGQELALACGVREPDDDAELAALQRLLGARYAWLTRGEVETLGLAEDPGGEAAEGWRCPPLRTDPVDTIGAGDAFFTLAMLSAASGLPLPLATFIGQLAGAQAVRVVGNSEPVDRAALLKDGIALLTF